MSANADDVIPPEALAAPAPASEVDDILPPASLRLTKPTAIDKPTEQTPILTQVGHAAMDLGGTLARGAGATMDLARNVAANIPGSKATPVEYGSPDSEAVQLSAPFQHEPDVQSDFARKYVTRVYSSPKITWLLDAFLPKRQAK